MNKQPEFHDGYDDEEPTLSGARPRVLVVDDDPSSLELVRFALRAESYDIVETCSGHEMLERVANWVEAPYSELPDVIICDILLPGFDGLNLVASLRREGCRVPIVLMTGSDDDSVSLRAAVAGANALLRKPFAQKALRTAVRGLVTARAA